MTAPRLIVFDADGTLRRTRVPGRPCPRAAGEWELIPGVSAALRATDWSANGTRLAIASNQDQVGYGLFSGETARQLLVDMVRAALGRVPAGCLVTFCPHVIEARCACRKPEPGLLLHILAETGIAPGDALFVGDAEVDREAARRAAMPFRWAHEYFGR